MGDGRRRYPAADSLYGVETARSVFREVLLHIRHRKKGLLLFCGREYRGPVIAAAIKPVLEGATVAVVDGGSMFDPYVISRVSRMVNADPRRVLPRFFISRGFTCHQMEHLLVFHLPTLMDKEHPRLLIVAGLLETFYDDDVPLKEASTLFRRTITALSAYARELPILVISPLPPAVAGERSRFFTILTERATHIYPGNR
jgi:hypothetical protein